MGRPRGSRNVTTLKWVRQAAEGGITPLEYMLNVLRDEDAKPELRMEAAAKAAPYIHPKLMASHVKVDVSDNQTDAGPIPRVREILESLITEATTGDSEIPVQDGFVLPAPVRDRAE